MTKHEIDDYFSQNWEEIKTIVKNNSAKRATINNVDITTDIYLVCVEKAEGIKSLPAFIRILASNIYRWERSDFNTENKVLAGEFDFNGICEEESYREEEKFQNRVFAIERYKANAEPHELRLFDIFCNKGVRTVRGIEKHLGVSFHGANVMIKDFKFKLREYERQAEIKTPIW